MDELGAERIVVELWPSLVEIQTSREDNAYLGRLTEFYESVDSLLRSLHSSNPPVDASTNVEIDNREGVARAWPPAVLEIVAFLGSSGVALGLCKLLRLWVDLKNGRRIKIVDGSLEIEATQLTQKQFMELLETLRKRGTKMKDPSELKEALAKKEFNPVSVDSVEAREERRVLENAARSRTKLSGA